MLNIFFTFALGFALLWQAPQRPVFRSEVNYVELDVSVTGKDGARVRGLTKDDFEVLENGKPQAVSAFTEVNLPMPPARPGNAPLRLADPSVATNTGLAEGRVYVIVMDYGTLAAEGTPKVKRQAAEFITDFLGPDDLAAVVSLGSTSRATEFTANKARLLAALNVTGEFVGSPADLAKDATPTPSGVKYDDAFDDTIAAYADMEASHAATLSIDRLRLLGNVAEFLRGLQGRRKSIIYVSQGIDATPATADPGSGGLAQNALAGWSKQLTETLQASGVSLYSIDPRGTNVVDPFDGGGSATPLSRKIGPDYLGAMEFLRGVALDTGGIPMLGYGDLTGPYRSIVEDNSSYYVLGYESNQKLDNSMHDIRVRVRGRDVDVRTRDRIEAVKPGARLKPDQAALASAWRGEDIKSLLARPLPAGDLGLAMRATASAIGMRGRDAVVQLSVEVDGAGFTFQPANEIADAIDVAFQALDTTQKLTASREDHVALSLSADTRDAVTSRGWRYVTEFTVPPGLYQLRIAAAESNGHRTGSVFLDVPVPNVATSMPSIMGLALTSQAARMVPTAGSTPMVRMSSKAPVTAMRTFNVTDTLNVLAGIVDTTPAHGPIVARAELRARDGAVVVNAPLGLTAANVGVGAPPHVFVIPLKTAAPGEYDIVVRVTDGPKSATRTLPITVVR